MKEKKALRGCNRCDYCFRYRNSRRVSSQIREKTNEQNSRRRTRSIGKSEKTPAVNHLESKAASYRQEISLFQSFGQWSAAQRKKGREVVPSHPYPTPSLLLFFSVHISLRCPHGLNSWNKLSRDKSRDQFSMSRNIQITEQKDLQMSSLFLASVLN